MMRPAALVETRRGPTAFGSTLGTRDGTVLASLAEREEEEEEETEPRDGWEGEDDADDASTSTEGSRGSAGAGAGAKENQARGASAVPQSGDSPRRRSPRANGSGAANGHSEGGLSAGAAAARADAERAAAEAGPGGDVKFDEESEPDRMLVMTTTLVCGEVAYATKSRLMHDKWAVKVEEEWKAQADKERTAGIPATDVSQQQNAKRHLHNIRQVAKPLYTEFCAQFGQKQLLMNINLNANHWNKRCAEPPLPQSRPVASPHSRPQARVAGRHPRARRRRAARRRCRARRQASGRRDVACDGHIVWAEGRRQEVAPPPCPYGGHWPHKRTQHQGVHPSTALSPAPACAARARQRDTV